MLTRCTVTRGSATYGGAIAVRDEGSSAIDIAGRYDGCVAVLSGGAISISGLRAAGSRQYHAPHPLTKFFVN